MIAQSVDNLGDQFRPAIRAGWLSYIRRVYPHDGAPDAGLVVGEGTFVRLRRPRMSLLRCWKLSLMMDYAISL